MGKKELRRDVGARTWVPMVLADSVRPLPTAVGWGTLCSPPTSLNSPLSTLPQPHQPRSRRLGRADPVFTERPLST